MTADAGIEAMRHALPADTERSPHSFTIDGVEPRVAFAPDDEFEVATLLRIADEHGLTVVPQGTRTSLSLGRPLETYDVALELRGLHRVVEYVPDDLTITVEAGMHLDALQEVLGEHGQYLTVDPPPDDHVSIGGLLATARPGAWRGFLPAARDLILGMETALPSGELTHSGGRVVKNVTGYDLHRMHTGALGTLGVITKATFKVAPRPAAAQSARLAASAVDEAAALGRRLWDVPLAARAITVLAAGAAERAGLPAEPAVLIECAGGEEAVDRSLIDVAMLSRTEEAPASAWVTLRHLAGDRNATVLRAGIAPTRIELLTRAFEDAGCAAWAHVAAGSVLGHTSDIDAATVEDLRALAVEHGGFLQIETAPAELRRAVDPFGSETGALLRSLKDQLDPRRTLNRGRWMEGL
jgi:glycolate oxidase FAD binding subunit